MGALKSMAASFTAFDHQTYQQLISNHTKDVLCMPPKLLDFFEKGGFTVSLSGRQYHSVGLAEAHEMLINKHTKEAIVRLSKEYVNRMAKYIPHRMKQLDKFKAEVFNTSECSDIHHTALPTILTTDHRTNKQEQKIIKLMEKVEELLPNCDHISANHGLSLLTQWQALLKGMTCLTFTQLGKDHLKTESTHTYSRYQGTKHHCSSEKEKATNLFHNYYKRKQ